MSYRSGSRQPKDFYIAFGVAGLTVLTHTCALIDEFARATGSGVLTSPTVPRLLLFIGLSLLVNVAGLWARKVVGKFVSIIALISAVTGYVVWYIYSRSILEALAGQPFYLLHTEAVPPHTFGLVGATWLNIVVLLLSGVLLIWEVKTLRGMSRTLK